MDAYDAVVIGGGAAGLAATVTLARARRRVLLVDAGQQRNRFADHSHGVLGFDGTSPGLLIDRGRAEAARYGATLVTDRASSAAPAVTGFTVRLDTSEVAARHLLVATGVRDGLPDIPGVQEQWGRGVVVCPYCDGWESRDRRIGILATGRKSLDQAQLLRQWSARITLFTAGRVTVTGTDRSELVARGIRIEERRVDRVEQGEGDLVGLVVEGELVELDRIFTAPDARPNDAVLDRLGAEFDGAPPARRLRVTRTGATTVAGVWAAGNVVNPSLKVQTAAGDGMAAGADLNEALVRLDVRSAVSSTPEDDLARRSA